ncbi:MAG: hypothetical protein ACOYNS_14095 [Bacteroidota bacterium]
MSGESKNEMLIAKEHLFLADEMMKKGNHEKALEYVRKVYEKDSRNMYARAYEERILITIAEAKAQKESERILSARMRDFIASQEKPSIKQPNTSEHHAKVDPILKEIDDSIATAREKLYEVFISKLANPEDAATKAKSTISALTKQLEERFKKISGLMIDHERDMLNAIEENQRIKTRKLYRSMVYMMHKLGVPFEHRGSLLYLVNYYGGFTPEEEKELKHNAELGIYEDLLKNVHLHQNPSEQNVQMLEQIRKDFMITDMEHDMVLAQAKNALLITEMVPTIAVIDANVKVREFVTEAVRTEFPKVQIASYDSPEVFLSSTGESLPNIVLSGTLFNGPGFQGIELLKSLKQHASVKDRTTDLILMLPSNDPLFREAVEEMGFGQVLQKPFSRELLLWTLRPFMFKAAGAPVIS